MFDGGSAAAPVPARNESTPVVGGNDTRERRSNLRGESDPGLTGVVGVGVRSNSVSGEDNDEEESAVSSLRYKVTNLHQASRVRTHYALVYDIFVGFFL